MRLAFFKSAVLAALLICACGSQAQDAPEITFGLGAQVGEAPKGLAVVAEMVPAEVPPGGKFELVVHLQVPEGAHAFPNAEQKASQSSSVSFLSAAGLQFEAPVWPKGERHEYKELDMVDTIYKGEVLIRIPGTAGKVPGTYLAKGVFKGPYCDDVGSCYMPKEYPWQAQVTVSKPAEAVAPVPAPAPGPMPDPSLALPFVVAKPAAGLHVSAQTRPVAVAPGDAFEVVVQVAADKGLHTYPDAAQNPADFSTLEVTDAGGLSLGKTLWPQGTPHKNVSGKMEPVYFGTTELRLRGMAPKAAGTHTIRGFFNGYYCDDQNHCFLPKKYPWEAQVVVDGAALPSVLPAADSGGGAGVKAIDPVSFSLPWGPVTVDPNSGGGFLLFLALAAVGGFVLNFMPCVLPVIPIKIMGLAHAAGGRNRRLFLGAVMSGGVMALWLGLGFVLAFSSFLGGTADIFRYPLVNLLLGLFIVAMAFAATGLFAIRLPQGVYRIAPKHDSVAGSFGFGIMTGIFALPCTGPFMGTAAAAVLRAGDASFTLAVFAAIGFGMALPYFVLAANPKWVEKLPRSGPSSDVMKHFLGWMMLAGGAYFVQSAITQWVMPESHFGKRLGVMVALALLGTAGAALAWGCGKLLRAARSVVAAVFLALGLAVASFSAWQVYEEVATRPFPFLAFAGEAQLPIGQGKIVVVDFRSTNCLNCDYNEKTVFNTTDGRALLGADDVAAYQANIDHGEAAKYLQKISGNVAVPFLVIYDAKGKEAAKLDAVITAEQLRLGLEKARGGK